jgi:transposase
MKIKLVAIDLAKLVFQVCVVAVGGKVLFNKKLSRAQFIVWLKDLKPTTIAMEACATAHFWGRKLQASGHQVLLVPAQHVKAFCRVHKSDSADALAIAEAAQRPDLHFVPVKTAGQQDLQLLGRVRGKLVAQRTETICQIRGLAGEYGVIFPKQRAQLMALVPAALEDAENGLTAVARRALHDLYEGIRALDTRIAAVMVQMTELAQLEPAYARLLSVPGFGAVVAPAFIAAVGDGKQFKRGRDVAAWLGLVPRQDGTGGITKLHRITKNGDRELRTLLIHGARAVLTWAPKRDDAKSRWILGLKARRGAPRAVVAYANKLARVGWAVLRGDGPFDVNKAFRPCRR